MAVMVGDVGFVGMAGGMFGRKRNDLVTRRGRDVEVTGCMQRARDKIQHHREHGDHRARKARRSSVFAMRDRHVGDSDRWSPTDYHVAEGEVDPQ